MASINQAILKTLVYADVFKFPLKKDEIWMYLVYRKLVSRQEIDKALLKLSPHIQRAGEYFFLVSSKKALVDRLQREEASKKKRALGKQLAYYLSFIPTVMFIGISGAVAVGNADWDDDIDFFLICRKGSVWVSRLYCLAILQLLGRRRSRRGVQTTDMICLNMILDESVMSFPKSEQSLYLAHEITQLYPLFSREDTYLQFLFKNVWVLTYLPNAFEEAKKKEIPWKKKMSDTFLLRFFMHPVMLQLSKFLQRMYMRGNKRNETVNDTKLAFHPYDYGIAIMKKYKQELQKLLKNE